MQPDYNKNAMTTQNFCKFNTNDSELIGEIISNHNGIFEGYY